MSQTCGTCHFYRTLGADPKSQCVRLPPAVFITFFDAPTEDNPINKQMMKHTTYPAPDPDWTCGEWRDKRDFEPCAGDWEKN